MKFTSFEYFSHRWSIIAPLSIIDSSSSSTNTGTVPSGLIFRNSYVFVSPFDKSRYFVSNTFSNPFDSNSLINQCILELLDVGKWYNVGFVIFFSVFVGGKVVYLYFSFFVFSPLFEYLFERL
jgi:hypothetical protein